MRVKFLKNLGRWAGEKTWWMLLIVIVITLIFGGMAGQLEMSMDMTSLLPKDDPMVDEFNYIFEEFNGASTIFIAVQGEMENMIDFAEHISPQVKNLESWITQNGSDKVRQEFRTAMDKVEAGKIEYAGHYIERVEYQQPVEFMKNHGLMLFKSKDLENISEIYYDPNLQPFLTNLNNSLEKEYIQSEEKISTTQREQNAVRFLDGIESWVDYTGTALLASDYNSDIASAAAEAVGIGNPYLVSPDRSMMLIMVEPTFGMLEVDHLLPTVNGLEELVKSQAGQFKVSAGLAGGVALARDEYVAGMEDSMSLTMIALVLILILFVVTFRMLSAPLLAMINLLVGLTWAMGASWLLVGTLNMFTAMMAVVLVGLGIDFSIHIISVFSELTNKGVAPGEAIIETMRKVGTGIITGALTTAAAFLTLVIGRSAGVSEFGLVCGVGLIVIMAASLLTMPVLIMIRERYREWRKKGIKTTRDVSFQAVGSVSQNIFRKWRFSLVLMTLVTIFFGYMITRVTFDYNYLNMEPVGLESILLNDQIIEKFNFSSDATMMTAKSLEENERFAELAKKKSSVSYVESITDYLPVPEEQERRKAGIREIAAKMQKAEVRQNVTAEEWDYFRQELERLEANIIEMQDLAFTGGQDMVDDKATRLVGNPDRPEILGNLTQLINELNDKPVAIERISKFNQDFGAAYKPLVLDMADATTLTVAVLPEMIKNKHISKNGDRFLLTLYPRGDVWSIDYLEIFTTEVLSISPSISGTPPMFYYLMKIIGEDGKRAAFLTLFVVLLLLWLDFKSLKLALLAMLPLLIGVVWMVGFMGLTGLQLTLLNIIAVPLILGIGIDDGVHLIHRYQIEGKGSIFTVFSSTGKAVSITSFTTMLAFGSLVFATYRGFGSMGLALFIGVGMCLLASIFVLPAVIGAVEK